MAAGERFGRDGPVVITNREIYAEVQQVKGVLQTMTGQTDLLKDHENRIRSLEKWRYALPPTLALAIASLIAALIGGTHG